MIIRVLMYCVWNDIGQIVDDWVSADTGPDLIHVVVSHEVIINLYINVMYTLRQHQFKTGDNNQLRHLNFKYTRFMQKFYVVRR